MRVPRAVAYLRCSTDKQPLSLDDQRRSIARWAEQTGSQIVRWYADEAISGASALGRDGFQSMVTELEEKRDADLVLCYDISRFGRTDNDEAGFYRYRLRQAGAEVVYIAESAVNGGETDELLVPILQYQKREQLRSLSRDTLRGTMGLAQRGAWCGGPAPFGYAREIRAPDGRSVRRLRAGERSHTENGEAVFLVPGDLLEVEAVRLAWDLRYLEWKSFDAIRDRIAALGVAPRRSSSWRSSSVRAMLINPVYTGRATYGLRTSAKFHRVSSAGVAVARPRKESGRFSRKHPDPIVVQGAHEPLASPGAILAFQAWEREGTDKTRRRPQRTRIRKSSYLLAGLVKCARCGFNYVGHRSSSHKNGRSYSYAYYICGGTEGSGRKACPRFAIPTAALEEAVLEQIRNRWSLLDRAELKRRVREGLEKPTSPSFDVAAVRQQIVALDARMISVAEGLDPEHRDVINRTLRKLKSRREALVARIEEEKRRARAREEALVEIEELVDMVTAFPTLWNHATKPERKELLRCFIRGVKIVPDNCEMEVDLWEVPAENKGKRKRLEGVTPPRRSCVTVVAGAHFARTSRIGPTLAPGISPRGG